MLNSQETRILETSYDRLKSREITFQVTQGKSWRKSRSFPMGYKYP